MPSMMIAVSPKTLENSASSCVLKPLMCASIRALMAAGGLFVTVILFWFDLGTADEADARLELVEHVAFDANGARVDGPRNDAKQRAVVVDQRAEHACLEPHADALVRAQVHAAAERPREEVLGIGFVE